MLRTSGYLQSMTDLLLELVSRPSRAGVDSPEPVLTAISRWLDAYGIAHQRLRDDEGRPVGIGGAIRGPRPGPTYLLDATADTAPFGDVSAWRFPPGEATIEDGWLYGRGSADSKAGIAVFCHVLADLLPQFERFAGNLEFLFDAEEHTGTFEGIRGYIAVRTGARIDGAMIGYPGNDRLVIGARGFLRARLTIRGVGAHSGSSSHRGTNAIERASALLADLRALPASAPHDGFPLPPRLSPTSIRCDGDFSLVPELSHLELDIRLTPEFDEDAARRFVDAAVRRLDADADAPPTTIEWIPGWPAYQLDPSNPMVRALSEAAGDAFGHEVAPAVAGPSNIGNYLATLGIPATAGLGATFRNIHAPDECVLLDSLEPTFVTYREALMRLLG